MRAAREDEGPAGAGEAKAPADLTYATDAEPGIRRRRAGKGFTYIAPDGARLADPAVRDRIRALAIPPAWTDVWISPDPDGHMQATGRDQKGRKQYRYHAGWTAHRDETKFASLTAFASSLPKIRDRIDRDLRQPGITRERVLASVVWLLDRTLIRIGNEAYSREGESFGLTTLRNRHVTVEGQRIRFAFVGKSGRAWKLTLSDRRMARILAKVENLPGQHLFQYLDEQDQNRLIHSNDVNAYLRETAGPDFTSKHFRTWAATTGAAILFAEREKPATGRELARATNEVVDAVADRLRNTRAVCRRCYVHPLVFERWEEGTLGEEIRQIRRRSRRPLRGLNDDESTVLRWLRRQGEGDGGR
ncbi:DNA topoisomerase IB [Aquibium carbonis]|uniref:DNA topoisomerase n=1 Tax=Aquibium carbonis TaxID=2495581 RepID=A0A3S0AAT0_9HYPH|nr:DNA topoisomerase IB [Aquibium carbonis]RST87529.1 DNA topoisomerase IB [Aquibium carbonis]